MIKSCLIFAPHPDDELILAAGILAQLRQHSVKTTVVITTNGDFQSPSLTLQRAKEAIEVKNFWGISNLIYLGYADSYKGKHIIECSKGQTALSASNHTETYNVGNLETFHSMKYGCQCQYTRENYKSDIKDVVLDTKADLIICVDMDWHLDHRALSILFEEVMSEMLKETDYTPVILKRFAYNGGFFGNKDYFASPIGVALPTAKGGPVDETLVLPYRWNDRIQVATPSDNYIGFYWNSPIYKSFAIYKSQSMASRFSAICNADTVFFYKNTKGVQYKAKISVSSGDSSYLNDFSIGDIDDFYDKSYSVYLSKIKAWIPSTNDDKKQVLYDFDSEVRLSNIVIYQAPDSEIEKIELQADNNFIYSEKFVDVHTSKISIQLPTSITTTHLSMCFKSSRNIAVCEIELYGDSIEFPWDEMPFVKYSSDNVQQNKFLCRVIGKTVYNTIEYYRGKKYRNLLQPLRWLKHKIM